jgi:hypothetical protein
MKKITTVGLDLAKSVFQVHAIAQEGDVFVRRALRSKRAVDGDRDSVVSSRGLGRPTDLVDVVRQDGVVSQTLLKPPLV